MGWLVTFVAPSETETDEVSPLIISRDCCLITLHGGNVDAAARLKRQLHLYSPAVPILANRLSGAARKRRWSPGRASFPGSCDAPTVSSNRRSHVRLKVNKASSVFLFKAAGSSSFKGLAAAALINKVSTVCLASYRVSLH